MPDDWDERDVRHAVGIGMHAWAAVHEAERVRMREKSDGEADLDRFAEVLKRHLAAERDETLRTTVRLETQLEAARQAERTTESLHKEALASASASATEAAKRACEHERQQLSGENARLATALAEQLEKETRLRVEHEREVERASESARREAAQAQWDEREAERKVATTSERSLVEAMQQQLATTTAASAAMRERADRLESELEEARATLSNSSKKGRAQETMVTTALRDDGLAAWHTGDKGRCKFHDVYVADPPPALCDREPHELPDAELAKLRHDGRVRLSLEWKGYNAATSGMTEQHAQFVRRVQQMLQTSRADAFLFVGTQRVPGKHPLDIEVHTHEATGRAHVVATYACTDVDVATVPVVVRTVLMLQRRIDAQAAALASIRSGAEPKALELQPVVTEMVKGLTTSIDKADEQVQEHRSERMRHLAMLYKFVVGVHAAGLVHTTTTADARVPKLLGFVEELKANAVPKDKTASRVRGKDDVVALRKELALDGDDGSSGGSGGSGGPSKKQKQQQQQKPALAQTKQTTLGFGASDIEKAL